MKEVRSIILNRGFAESNAGGLFGYKIKGSVSCRKPLSAVYKIRRLFHVKAGGFGFI